MAELLEYSHEIGLLIHDPLLGLVVAMLCGFLIWLWPELGVAIFALRPQLLENTEFTSGFLGYRLSLDHILMLVLAVRLWFLFVRRKETVHALANDPIVKYSLLLTGWILAYPLLIQGWGAHLLVFRQLQRYAIPVFGTLIFCADGTRLSRLVNSSFALLALLQLAFALEVLPLAAQGVAVSRNTPLYGIAIWGAQGPLAVIFALAYWLVPTDRRTGGWLCAPVALAGLLTTVLGQARNMWIATPVAAAFVLVRSGRMGRWFAYVAVAGSVALLVIALAVPTAVGNLQNVVLDVLGLRYEATTQPGALSGRDVFWANALQSFARSPIWGVGYRQAAGEFERVRDGVVVVTRPSVHNYFLGILSEQGLIGFVLLLAVLRRLAVVLKENLKAPAENPEIRRWQLLAAGLTVYALVTLSVSYWAAILALVAHKAASIEREAPVASPARTPMSRLSRTTRLSGARSLPYLRSHLDTRDSAP